jgi:hypothetical protein
MNAEPPVLLRIEKGEPDLTEIGALTAVLYARLRSTVDPPAPARVAARWRRPERLASFTDPRTWRNTTR